MDKLLSDLQEEITKYYDIFIALLPKLGMAIIAFILFALIAGLVRKKIMKLVNNRIDDPLLGNFINRIFRVVNVTIAILIFLAIIGKTGVVTSILGVAGVSAFVIGFAFKDIGENFLAGIIMAFKRPFRLGDTIETGGITGTIVGLNMRDTHVKTFDGKDVYIPNGQILKNPLFNYTIDGYLRKEFTIGLDYDSDVDQAIEILYDVMSKQKSVIQEVKSSMVSVSELTPSTLNLNVKYWIDTFDPEEPGYITGNKAITACIDALSSAGFNMPGDILELKNYKNNKLFVEQEEKKKQNEESKSA